MTISPVIILGKDLLDIRYIYELQEGLNPNYLGEAYYVCIWPEHCMSENYHNSDVMILGPYECLDEAMDDYPDAECFNLYHDYGYDDNMDGDHESALRDAGFGMDENYDHYTYYHDVEELND